MHVIPVNRFSIGIAFAVVLDAEVFKAILARILGAFPDGLAYIAPVDASPVVLVKIPQRSVIVVLFLVITSNIVIP